MTNEHRKFLDRCVHQMMQRNTREDFNIIGAYQVLTNELRRGFPAEFTEMQDKAVDMQTKAGKVVDDYLFDLIQDVSAKHYVNSIP